MRKFAFALTAVALVLTGCNNTKALNETASASAVMASEYQPFTKAFLCDNGIAPSLYYPNDSQAQLTLEGVTTTLNIAPSASGERYVTDAGIFGHGGEWHQKGDMAVFSYKGVHGNPAQVNCTAE